MYLKKLILFFSFTISSFSQELGNLLDNLNDYSDKTNLNIDYKPTAMTVLYASDLESFGINTLGEALDFVAGIQTFKTTSVTSVVSVRGYTQPLNVFHEKIKYRINGVSASSNYFENFPINLIERVEISKGNASTIYDQSGFVAVVDIITKDKNSIYFGTGSFDSRNFSLLLNEKLNDKWNLKFATSYLKNNKKVDAPSGILTNSETFGTTFNRKRESLEGVEDFLIGGSLQSENLKISSKYIKNEKQNNYGFTGMLDWSDDGYTNYEIFSNEIAYNTFINSNNILETKLGSVESNYKMNTYLYKFEPNNFEFMTHILKLITLKERVIYLFLLKIVLFQTIKLNMEFLGLILKFRKINIMQM